MHKINASISRRGISAPALIYHTMTMWFSEPDASRPSGSAHRVVTDSRKCRLVWGIACANRASRHVCGLDTALNQPGRAGAPNRLFAPHTSLFPVRGATVAFRLRLQCGAFCALSRGRRSRVIRPQREFPSLIFRPIRHSAFKRASNCILLSCHRSRRLSCPYRSSGERRKLMIRREPVLISTVTAMPGVSWVGWSSMIMLVLSRETRVA